MDKSDFDRIVITKQKNRDRLDELKIDLSVFIYACLIREKSLKYILEGVRERLKSTNFTHLRDLNAHIQAMVRKSYKLSQTPSKARKNMVFEIVNKESLFKSFDKASSDWLREEEIAEKERVLNKALEEPERVNNIDDLKCFSLASRHDDCAEDHKPYQGKLYVKKWALKYKEIYEYCEKHDIKTVEWVIERPAWFITRPNCRHFFKDLTWSEVKGSSISVLLKEYGADRVAGSKGAWQNIKHKTRKEWYTEQNVRAIIKKYKNRLKKHEEMAKIYENENLKNEILKDKSLIRKWEMYLEKLTNV